MTFDPVLVSYTSRVFVSVSAPCSVTAKHIYPNRLMIRRLDKPRNKCQQALRSHRLLRSGQQVTMVTVDTSSPVNPAPRKRNPSSPRLEKIENMGTSACNQIL